MIETSVFYVDKMEKGDSLFSMVKHNCTPAAALDWDEPRFETLWSSAAIGCNLQWLGNTLSRQPILYPLSPEERIRENNRNYFLFKFRTVFHLALIRRLSSVLPLAAARDLSRVCVESDHLFPADLVPDGRARYLVITPATGESLMLVREKGAPEIGLDDLFSDETDWEPRIVLNVTPIFDDVVEKLDPLDTQIGEVIVDVSGELIG